MPLPWVSITSSFQAMPLLMWGLARFMISFLQLPASGVVGSHDAGLDSHLLPVAEGFAVLVAEIDSRLLGNGYDVAEFIWVLQGNGIALFSSLILRFPSPSLLCEKPRGGPFQDSHGAFRVPSSLLCYVASRAMAERLGLMSRPRSSRWLGFPPRLRFPAPGREFGTCLPGLRCRTRPGNPRI